MRRAGGVRPTPWTGSVADAVRTDGSVRGRSVSSRSAAGLGGGGGGLGIPRDLVGVRTGQGGVELGWLAGEQLVGVGDAAGAGERPELKGQPVGGQRRRLFITWKCRCGKSVLPLLPTSPRT